MYDLLQQFFDKYQRDLGYAMAGLLVLSPLWLMVALSWPRQFADLLVREFDARSVSQWLRVTLFFGLLALLIFLTYQSTMLVLANYVYDDRTVTNLPWWCATMYASIVVSSFLLLRKSWKHIHEDPFYHAKSIPTYVMWCWMAGQLTFVWFFAEDWLVLKETIASVHPMYSESIDSVKVSALERIAEFVRPILDWPSQHLLVLVLLPALAGLLVALFNHRGVKFLQIFQKHTLSILTTACIVVSFLLLAPVKWIFEFYDQLGPNSMDQPPHQLLSTFVPIVLACLLVYVLSRLPRDSREIGSSRKRKHDLATVESTLKAGGWIDKQNKATGKPLVFVIAEGGGIHAANRTLLVLAKLQADSERARDRRKADASNGITRFEFWDCVYGTSTVSGGSIGMTAFMALMQARALSQKNGRVVSKNQDLQRMAMRFNSQDLLLPMLFGICTIEPLAAVFGAVPGMRFLDRAKSFQHAIAVGLEASVDRPTGKPVNAKTMGLYSSLACLAAGEDFEHAAANKNLCFNTTSAFFGTPMAASGVVSGYYRSLANMSAASDLTLIEACCLSARFPIITPYGRVRVGTNARKQAVFETFVDGGIVDNSGTYIASLQISEVRSVLQRYGINIPIIAVVVGSLKAQDPEELRKVPCRLPYRSGVLTFIRSAVATLYTHNEGPKRAFHSFCERNEVTVCDFRWDTEIIQPSLGWYVSERKRRAFAWAMGYNRWIADEDLGHDAEPSRLNSKYVLEYDNLRDNNDIIKLIADRAHNRKQYLDVIGMHLRHPALSEAVHKQRRESSYAMGSDPKDAIGSPAAQLPMADLTGSGIHDSRDGESPATGSPIR